MKYTKTAFFFLVAFAVIALSPRATFAFAVEDNGSSVGTIGTQDNNSSVGDTSAPATEDNGGSSSGGTPATEDNNSSVGTGGSPATEDNNSSVGTGGTPATENNNSSVGTGGAPATEDNNSSVGTSGGSNGGNGGGSSGGNGGGSSSGGGVSVGGGSGYVSSGSGSVMSLPVCEPINGFLTRGSRGAEVTKLQNFLRNVEGINVAVTGIYDAQTVEAVKAFQNKYAQEILAPWGTEIATGNVYMTTLKKINSRACGTPLTLNSAELAILNAAKASRIAGTYTGTEVVGTITPGSTVGTSATTSIEGTVVTSGTTTDGETQVAAAAEVSIWTKIWNFIKRIFGR